MSQSLENNDIPDTVLSLTVRNHAGTLSHVAGLFARRAFNLEAVMVLPIEQGKTSLMLLRVKERKRLHQVISQLQKLEDVISVEKDPKISELLPLNAEQFSKV